MVGYDMKGDNRGASPVFCSLHRTMGASFHGPLLLPAPVSGTCVCLVCFPERKHNGGCPGTLDGAVSLAVLPASPSLAMQNGVFLWEFCSFPAHLPQKPQSQPPPFPWLTPRCGGEGSCVPPGLFARWPHAPHSLSQGTHCSNLTFLLQPGSSWLHPSPPVKLEQRFPLPACHRVICAASRVSPPQPRALEGEGTREAKSPPLSCFGKKRKGPEPR